MLERGKICLIADQHDLYDDRAYWKQCLSLKKAGYDVFYIVINSKKAESGETEHGVKYHLVKRKQYLPNRFVNYFYKKIFPVKTEYDEVVDLCKIIKADIYQLIDLRVNRITQLLKSLSQKPKLIYDIHEPADDMLVDVTMSKWILPQFLKRGYARVIQKWEYKKAALHDFIIVTDDALEERFEKIIEPDKVECIYNYSNLNTYKNDIDIENKKYDIGYVGGISEIRGILTLVEAVRIIKMSITAPLSVLVLGNISDPKFKKKLSDTIQKYNLEHMVKMPGFVPYGDVHQYYNQIKIGVNPLHNIKKFRLTMPIKIFEYMSFGIPVITSNFKYMCKIVTENEAGICVEPGNPNELAKAILNLLDSPQQLRQMGDNALKAVKEKYNWQNMEKNYLRIIQNLLDGRR